MHIWIEHCIMLNEAHFAIWNTFSFIALVNQISKSVIIVWYDGYMIRSYNFRFNVSTNGVVEKQ